MTIIFLLKLDPVVFDIEQTVAGNRGAVSVAANVIEHLLRSGERTFGIHYPLALFQSTHTLNEVQFAKEFQGREEL